MGYAFPGAVIAVGVLSPWRGSTTGWRASEPSGPWAGPSRWCSPGPRRDCLFAYLVWRFLAVGFQTVDANLTRWWPRRLDDAARSLGLRLRWGLLSGVVHLPLLRRGLLTALILVFVETMNKMPATLLLWLFGVNTLAVQVWEWTSESLWAEAAVPALAWGCCRSAPGLPRPAAQHRVPSALSGCSGRPTHEIPGRPGDCQTILHS